jgi:hypothetical protein
MIFARPIFQQQRQQEKLIIHYVDRVDRFLTYVALRFMMSDTNESNENIETAQKNQKKIGAAEDDPETTGPTENLREEAAEMVDKDEDSNEPA